MIIIIIFSFVIIGLLILLVKLKKSLQVARGMMHYYGMHLLGCMDDEDGIYRCVDSELVASIGMYLITDSERMF